MPLRALSLRMGKRAGYSFNLDGNFHLSLSERGNGASSLYGKSFSIEPHT